MHSQEELRAMYPGGRANPTARRYARFWAGVFATGLVPGRWVTLEVRGRRTGRLCRFPLGIATVDGERYLVSMLGEDCNWVANVRAAHGEATLRHGRAENVILEEVPVPARPPIIKAYLNQVPGGRPHIPVSRHADASQFVAIAATQPVFRVVAIAATHE